jgi:3-hydroxymyristoyl/3-hydroxydecanoyl-(acyl carrier protein) dehydratase
MINTDLEFCISKFVVAQEGESLKMPWTVPKEMSYFQGHFPAQSILPAVAIIDVTIEMVKKGVGKSFVLKEVKNSKFLRPVLPGYDVVIDFKKIAENRFKGSWTKDSELLVELDLILR